MRVSPPLTPATRTACASSLIVLVHRAGRAAQAALRKEAHLLDAARRELGDSPRAGEAGFLEGGGRGDAGGALSLLAGAAEEQQAAGGHPARHQQIRRSGGLLLFQHRSRGRWVDHRYIDLSGARW